MLGAQDRLHGVGTSGRGLPATQHGPPEMLAQHTAVRVTLLERAVGSEPEETHGSVRARHDFDSYYTSPFHASVDLGARGGVQLHP